MENVGVVLHKAGDLRMVSNYLHVYISSVMPAGSEFHFNVHSTE